MVSIRRRPVASRSAVSSLVEGLPHRGAFKARIEAALAFFDRRPPAFERSSILSGNGKRGALRRRASALLKSATNSAALF